MSVTIEVFPASEGDSILVSSNSSNVLIDAGLYETYHTSIRPRLLKLARESKKIDLFVVTHIDKDHIEGAIELLIENGNSSDPRLIDILEVWHNSYRHLQFEKEARIGEHEKEILRNIISSGRNYVGRTNKESKEISSKHGSSLASLLLTGKYSWNEAFQGKAVQSANSEQVEFNDIVLTLLSPDSKKLKRLENKWKNDLRRMKLNFVFSEEKIFDDAFEFALLNSSSSTEEDVQKPISSTQPKFENLIINEKTSDKSITNGSSIAFIMEICGVKILFLGDAHPDIITEQLEVMSKNESDRVYFDLVKISHHGSAKNTSLKLLRLIDCSKYIISTDGNKHGHPDIGTLAKIIHETRDKAIEIYCNYRTLNSQIIEDLIKSRNYRCTFIYPEDDKSLTIKL